MPPKGYRHSEETKRKISESHKASPKHCGFLPGHVMSEETRKRVSEAAKRRPPISEETRLRLREAHLGKKPSEAAKRKKSALLQGIPEDQWSGYTTPEAKRIRLSSEFADWRRAVFSRDGWTCQSCGVVGGKLHPHHIKEFSKFPDLRFDVDNGVTLCVSCHMVEHRLRRENGKTCPAG